jgi:rubrerythrin
MFVFGNADDVLAMALRIKENGRTLYEHAAQMTEDPVLKQLFEELTVLEECHIRCVKALRGQLPDYFPEEAVWDPEGLAKSYLESAADSHVFTEEIATERLKNVRTAPEALEMALQFEKDSMHFFLGMKDMIPDPAAKEEIETLISEEMGHIRLLSQAKRQCFPDECRILS